MYSTKKLKIRNVHVDIKALNPRRSIYMAAPKEP
jgi:hypothetical protein